ncbi:MAG TPA: hypothetical protein EYN79_05785, partial [Planctomycetes bacterium]|nr:hypothetical protein [Planctomycetota bacterium]
MNHSRGLVSLLLALVTALAVPAGDDNLAAAEWEILFFDSAFLPSTLTIDHGDTVRFTWVAGSHQLMSGFSGGTPGTPDEPGALFSATLDAANPDYVHLFGEGDVIIGFFDANNPAQVGAITVLGSALTFHVLVVDNEYIPPVISIFRGDTVRWTHEPMEMLHTVTSGTPNGAAGTIEEPGALFDELSTDSTPVFEYLFDAPMVLPYFCTPHWPFGMDGTVVVQELFIRGDSNSDSAVGIADAVTTLDYLFQSAGTPTCLDALDANDDGGVDLGDAIWTLA